VFESPKNVSWLLAGLGGPLIGRIVTERSLRRTVDLPAEERKHRFQGILAGMIGMNLLPGNNEYIL